MQTRKDERNQEFCKDNYPTQKMIQKNENRKKLNGLSLPKNYHFLIFFAKILENISIGVTGITLWCYKKETLIMLRLPPDFR